MMALPGRHAMNNPQTDITEILLHQGEDDLPFGAVSPPIFQTSIFCFPSYEKFQDA
jgi:cystathionine beta-lyase/cystathionine gamma-synthase